MPGSLKIKILSARNLPVMDRASDLTDAFVEIRIGNDNYKTEVCKKSLNPTWNTDWITFELDDQQLQEECVQIRVLDHDTYSAHDSIGKVYISLDTLLIRKKNRILTGWFPIYDTMHGIQGELNISLRLDLFSDVSRYRQSSIGVKFFFSNCVPYGYTLNKLIGFVEELIMMDDPEHEWREILRTSRSTNESRQRLFSKLTGELQRKMGVKVLEEGGNCVIGFHVHFDLEGETGVVVRGIGTVAELAEGCIIPDSGSPSRSPTTSEILSKSGNIFEVKEMEAILPKTQKIPSIVKQKKLDLGEFPLLTITHPPPGFIQSFGSVVSVKSVKLLEKSHSAEDRECRDAWWLELRREITAHMRSLKCTAVLGYTESCIIYEDVCLLAGSGTAIVLNLDFVDVTAAVSPAPAPASAAAAVVVTAPPKIANSSDGGVASGDLLPVDEKTALLEVAPHIISDSPNHEASLSTNGKLNQINSGDDEKVDDRNVSPEVKKESVLDKINKKRPPSTLKIDISKKFDVTTVDDDMVMRGCQMCHLPDNNDQALSKVLRDMCQVCGKYQVPEVIFSTSEIPEELDVRGQTVLIQARVCRTKRENKGEQYAKEINELLPFLEYDIHYKLVHNLFLKGLNGLFGLKIRLSIGQNLVVAVGTGTGVFLSALCAPSIPKSSEFTPEGDKLILKMKEFQDNCIRALQLNNQTKFNKQKSPAADIRNAIINQKVTSSARILNRSVSESGRRITSEKVFVDTGHLDLGYIASIIKEGLPPIGYNMETVNFTRGVLNFERCRMLVKFVRSTPLMTDGSNSNNSSSNNNNNNNSQNNSNSNVANEDFVSSHSIINHSVNNTGGISFNNSSCSGNAALSDKIDNLMQQFHTTLWLKLRRYVPFVINGVDYSIRLTDDNHLEILFSGFVTSSSPMQILDYKQSDENVQMSDLGDKVSYSKNSRLTTINAIKDKPNGDEVTLRQPLFLFSPLSTVPGFFIKSYLGSVNFFFIRETTYLREFKGASGFIRACIGEAQTVVTAYTQAAGGNAVLSCAINELVLHCATGTSGRQMNSAQLLVNVRGDMVHGTYATGNMSPEIQTMYSYNGS